MPKMKRNLLLAILVVSVSGSLVSTARAHEGATGGEWRNVGGDSGMTRYSPLDQINKDNIKNLKVAWEWTTADAPLMKENQGLRATYFQGTPLEVNGILYISTCLSQAAAINA